MDTADAGVVGGGSVLVANMELGVPGGGATGVRGCWVTVHGDQVRCGQWWCCGFEWC